jgi:chromosome segregation ATPase
MSEIYNSPILQDQNYSENPEDNFSEMKLYIQNVESKSNTLQKENENLQKAISILEKEKSNLANNLEQKDISLSELSQIIENYKRKENNYENKIKELEEVNQKLNYNIIQLNQKNKSLNSSLETFLKSPNLNNEKNNNTQIIQLNEKLDETEIAKQKIEFENKMLKNKINDIQNQYENEIKLLTNLKNGEI